MPTALKDQNRVTSRQAVLNTDTVQGTNLVNIAIDPSSKGIKINTSATISFTMTPIDPKDDNFKNVWLFQGADGLTYPAVATAAGELLVDLI